MFLYNLTLQQATGITHAICGNFRGLSTQEIVVSHGKSLDLIIYDKSSKKILTLCSTDLFASVRSVGKFRPSKEKDCLILSCDTGKFVIFEYNMKRNVFDKVYENTFGKSGTERTIPGQYLAVDPNGHAAMIAALESQKFVYVLNHEAIIRLSTPTPKSNTVIYDVVALDTKISQSTFACLETEYKSYVLENYSGQQMLSFYVCSNKGKITKHSKPLNRVGNLLIPVPCGSLGPGGVLICSENYISYKSLQEKSLQVEQPEIRCPIPKRKNELDDPERGIIINCYVVHKGSIVGNTPGYLILAQTEQGDLYKITLEAENNAVTKLKLKYFDTIPVATAMCILDSTYLFVASEFGNHFLYQFLNSVDDDSELEFSSAVPMEEGMTFLFSPHGLKNLSCVEEVESFSPITHCQVADLYQWNIPQLYLACGRGPRSTLRVLKYAVKVAEMSSLELREEPIGVWAFNHFMNGGLDSFIVISFEDSTLVLSLGATIDVTTHLGFFPTNPTLSSSRFGDNMLTQIHPDGIRFISIGHEVKANDWQCPDGEVITKCAINEEQIVVILSGTQLVYFELGLSAQLNEIRTKMEDQVTCLALSAISASHQKAMFLAVGLSGNMVRIISLDSLNILGLLNTVPLSDAPESLCITQMKFEMKNEGVIRSHFVLYIGLSNGVLLQKYLNQETGMLSNMSTRRLGYKPVKLFKIQVGGNDAVVATCESTWLSYCYQNDIHLVPLWHEALCYAYRFPSAQYPDSIIGIYRNKVSILKFDNLCPKRMLSHAKIRLKYTPRKFVFHQESKHIIVIESDHYAFTEKSKQLRKAQIAMEMTVDAENSEKDQVMKMAQTFMKNDIPDHIFGAPKAGLGMWASEVSIIDPINEEIITQFELNQDEAAVSICLLHFEGYDDIQFVLIGVAKDLHLCPRECSGGAIYSYKVSRGGTELKFFHKIDVPDVPYAMCAFQKKVLVGIGKVLHLFSMGDEELLQRCENKQLPNRIAKIHSFDNRIIVGDVEEGFHFMRYKQKENRLVFCCHDTDTRQVTSSALLDCNTIAGADKFGNIYVLRLPSSVDEEIHEETPCSDASHLKNGSTSPETTPQHKVELICCFHVGEMVYSLQKAMLLSGSADTLLYTTLSGSIGILAPFTSDEDHQLFQRLEIYMRSEYPSPCGRDHLSFRATYYPVKNVIDGDLCEKFYSLDLLRQNYVANCLNTTPSEVSAKLQDIRAKYAF